MSNKKEQVKEQVTLAIFEDNEDTTKTLTGILTDNLGHQLELNFLIATTPDNAFVLLQQLKKKKVLLALIDHHLTPYNDDGYGRYIAEECNNLNIPTVSIASTPQDYTDYQSQQHFEDLPQIVLNEI